MNLNKATLMGNLTHDPDVKTAAGQKVASFSIATNAVWRDAKSKALKKSVEFHPVTAWGKLAEVVEKYVRKGDRLYVEGRLSNRKWQDRNKQRHERTEVVAQQVIMLGSARKGAKPEAVASAADDGELSATPV